MEKFDTFPTTEQIIQLFNKITAEFSCRDASVLSNDERLLNYGETEFSITPLMYGEITAEGMAELISQLQKDHGLFA